MRLPATNPTPPAMPATEPAAAAQRSASVSAPDTGPAPPSPVAESITDLQALRELVDKLSQTIGTTGQQVQFSIDHDTRQTVLKVTDAESGALLRQIPGDEALSMARILDRMQGILISRKA